METLLENQALEEIWEQNDFDDALSIMAYTHPHNLPEPPHFNPSM